MTNLNKRNAKFTKFFVAFSFIVLFTTSHFALAQILSRNFDWDNNIATLNTKIVIFNKTTGQSKNLTTAQLAAIRDTLGKSGEHADYEFRPLTPGSNSSFKYYGDGPNGENYFLSQVQETLTQETSSHWQSPMWDDFVNMLSNPISARELTIITARGHDPTLMLEGLRYLQSKGYIRYLPDVKNIFPVSNPKIGADADSPDKTKAHVMMDLLDRLNARPLTEGPSLQIKSPEGTEGVVTLHQWDYSDDDPKNILTALKTLGPEVAKDRWPHVKITLTYTGVTGKLLVPGISQTTSPMELVIKPDGTARVASITEVADLAKHLALTKLGSK